MEEAWKSHLGVRNILDIDLGVITKYRCMYSSSSCLLSLSPLYRMEVVSQSVF